MHIFIDHSPSDRFKRRISIHPYQVSRHDIGDQHITKFFKAKSRQRSRFPLPAFRIEVIGGCSSAWLVRIGVALTKHSLRFDVSE